MNGHTATRLLKARKLRSADNKGSKRRSVEFSSAIVNEPAKFHDHRVYTITENPAPVKKKASIA